MQVRRSDLVFLILELGKNLDVPERSCLMHSGDAPTLDQRVRIRTAVDPSHIVFLGVFIDSLCFFRRFYRFSCVFRRFLESIVF